MIGLLLWASLASAREFRGRDEFGRACALRVDAKISVLVEGERYDGVNEGAKPLVAVRARVGGQTGELELHVRGHRPTWFRLYLESATGHAHACLLGSN